MNPSSATTSSSRSSDTAVADIPEEFDLPDTSSDESEGDEFDASTYSDTGPDTTLVGVAQSLIKMVDDEAVTVISEDEDELQVRVPSVDETRARASAGSMPRAAQSSRRDASQADEAELIDLPFCLDIAEVFNFNDPYWLRAIETQAESGLTDEVELCEFFEMSGNDVFMD